MTGVVVAPVAVEFVQACHADAENNISIKAIDR